MYMYYRWQNLAAPFCTQPPEVVKEVDERPPHARRYVKPKLKFVVQGIDLNQYTHKPIAYAKTGGRSPVDGKYYKADFIFYC